MAAEIRLVTGAQGSLRTHLVVLRPSVEVVTAREEARRLATGKVAYRNGFTPAINDAHVATTPRRLGLWLNSGGQRADETVGTVALFEQAGFERALPTTGGNGGGRPRWVMQKVLR